MIYIAIGIAATLLLLPATSERRRNPLLLPGLVPRKAASGVSRPRGHVIVAVTVSFLCLFLPAALRYGIGTDYWARYVPYFDTIAAGGEVDVDPGFVVIARGIALFTNDSQWLFVVFSLTTIALVYRFAVRMSLDPALTIFIYVFGGFYLEGYNSVRQALAVAIVLNTIELVMRRRWIWFIVLIALASTIHLSALIGLVLLPVMLIPLTRVARLVVTAAALAVVLTSPLFLLDLVSRFAPQYAWYFTSDYAGTRSYDPTEIAIAVISFIGIALLAQRTPEHRGYENAIANAYVLYVVALAVTVTFSYAFSRLASYFAPLQLVAIPLLLSRITDPRLRTVATGVVVIAYLGAFAYKFLTWNAHGVLPYESIFDRV